MTYFTHCIHCGASRQRARLSVHDVDLRGIQGVTLGKNGFDLSVQHIKGYTAQSVMVWCQNCEAAHPIEDYEVGFPWTLGVDDQVQWTDPSTGTPETVTVVVVSFTNAGGPNGVVHIQTEDDRLIDAPPEELTEV